MVGATKERHIADADAGLELELAAEEIAQLESAKHRGPQRNHLSPPAGNAASPNNDGVRCL
jgi:hypothetical protein